MGLALVFSLAGTDRLLLSNRARYPSSRPRMDGLSLIPPLSLEVEELVLVSCESRPDRESFLRRYLLVACLRSLFLLIVS